jgi:hypothetical protein
MYEVIPGRFLGRYGGDVNKKCNGERWEKGAANN